MNFPIRKLNLVSLIGLMLIGSLMAIGNAKLKNTAPKQQQERVIELARSLTPKSAPVELIEVKVREETVKSGEKFIGDEEWLKYASFKVRNKTDKTLSYLQINVDLPEILSGGVMFQHQLLLGRHPYYESTKQNKPIELKSGETIEISFAAEYDEIKRMVEFTKRHINQLSKIVIRFSEAGYEDKIILSGGEVFRRNPDPTGLTKWIRVVE